MPTRSIALALITIYVCVGTLQRANLRWTLGPDGGVIVSPAYHRRHHAADIQTANLGVVLTIWDVMAGIAALLSSRPAATPSGVPASTAAQSRWSRTAGCRMRCSVSLSSSSSHSGRAAFSEAAHSCSRSAVAADRRC